MVELKNPLFNDKAPSTQTLHADDFLAVTPDVAPSMTMTTSYEYDKTSVEANNYSADQRYLYSREGTPTVARVEAALSTLMDGYAMLTTSGLAAAFSVLTEYKPKKIAISAGYHGVRKVVEKYQQMSCNVTVVGLDCDFKDVDLVWVESPINPTGHIVDIKRLSLKAKAAGAVLVVDATLLPPPMFKPFCMGADVVIHSATKFLGGHTDLLCGVVVTQCSLKIKSMKATRAELGMQPGNMEAWLLLRSLRTLDVRVRQQIKTTERLVAILESWRKDAIKTNCHEPTCEQIKLGGNIKAVHYAGLEMCNKEDYPLGVGAVFAIELQNQTQALQVARTLRLHTFATSMGSVESLVDWRYSWDKTCSPGLLRVSVGLESYDDLVADWKQSLLGLPKETIVPAKL